MARWPAAAALAILAGACAGAASPGPPVFEAVEGAIDHTYTGDFNFYVGGGVAVFDCDDDRFPDLLVAGGEAPARLFRNAASGEVAFVPAEGPIEVAGVSGAYPLDIDADGITDLALLRFGENLLFRGLGDGRVERVP